MLDTQTKNLAAAFALVFSSLKHFPVTCGKTHIAHIQACRYNSTCCSQSLPLPPSFSSPDLWVKYYALHLKIV